MRLLTTWVILPLLSIRADPSVSDIMCTSPTEPCRARPVESSGNARQQIPKVIRQTHKPAKFQWLPVEVRQLAMTYRLENPAYDYEYYGDAAMRAVVDKYGHLIHNFSQAFDKATSGAMRADLWRYLLLWVEGGVYADIDTKALRPLPIRPDDHAVSGCGHFFHGVEQFILAYAPKHPVLKRAIELAIVNILQRSQQDLMGRELVLTGPVLLHEAATQVLQLGDGQPVNCSNFHGVWRNKDNSASIRILPGEYDCVKLNGELLSGSNSHRLRSRWSRRRRVYLAWNCGDVDTFGGTVQMKGMNNKKWNRTLASMGLRHYTMGLEHSLIKQHVTEMLREDTIASSLSSMDRPYSQPSGGLVSHL